jgi:hypothetical protein
MRLIALSRRFYARLWPLVPAANPSAPGACDVLCSVLVERQENSAGLPLAHYPAQHHHSQPNADNGNDIFPPGARLDNHLEHYERHQHRRDDYYDALPPHMFPVYFRTPRRLSGNTHINSGQLL